MSLSANLDKPLYHGSNVIVDKPSLGFSRATTDFGKGFYLTNSKEDATVLALEKGRSKRLAYGILNECGFSQRLSVSTYEFEE
ncbi:MAG: DUF3990 domain-containing protein, partial [Coriobacteriales bacterium]|nr:DUF3990 domain-containing protein [Coriobacteriales bacterium]